ncbi:MAG: MFS transporter [Actinobacteria bacterium]|nr:MFS transporter [Actinomycetota bacterium]
MGSLQGKPIQGRERRDLKALFFLFGLGVMCLAPRLPDIKANLDVSTTFFGILVSSGAIGALCSQLVMGHIIHRVGIYRVILIASVATYATIGMMVEIKNPWIYLIVMRLNMAEVESRI